MISHFSSLIYCRCANRFCFLGYFGLHGIIVLVDDIEGVLARGIAVLARSRAKKFPKSSCKVICILEAAFSGDLGNLRIPVRQKSGGVLKPSTLDIFGWRISEFAEEDSDEMLLCISEMRGDVREGYRLKFIFIYITFNSVRKRFPLKLRTLAKLHQSREKAQIHFYITLGIIAEHFVDSVG